ncbi:anhydro-N-acetylmuramic acid kinase [Flammeovirga pacifica]|uniref:Anhydro-N-acetylmuramic acid kinase n=2 Tax=Flammeovirga pacifica TaxID=915059 RepID=A0A1S1YUZ5_FLAPC|nr:anhydro-N-acetylmuramic acid kinase [Flammeovirga pacifica]
MSGTSLDGVDLCYAEFWKDSKRQWQYYMPYVESYPYSEEWRNRLNTAEHLSAFEYIQLDRDLGKKLGELAKCFIEKHQLKVDYVCSHGHTIFHQTKLGITSQIGAGPEIAVACGHNVINDFRVGDVALGGQGAPLVPIGDQLLFSQFHYRLNLGGIGNISYEVDNETIAFDTSPANMPLNIYMRTLGKEYDDQGAFARRGLVRKEIFDALNHLPFYQTFEKKSLGKEWVETHYLPLLNKIDKIEDRLATSIEHTAYQIKRIIDQAEVHSKIRFGKPKLLITGGGAFNDYMIERIRTYCSNIEVVLPNEKIINHKEALLFAFLGNLRLHKEINCLKSVTGAKSNSVGGIIHYLFPNSKEIDQNQNDINEEEDTPPDFNKIIGCGG